MASAAMMATYEKALERAHTDGLVIIGRGTRKSDGASVVYVTSSSKASAYEVAVYADRMECNCPAHAYCKHRAAAREYLINRAIHQAAKVQPVKREIRGYTDTRPITIWK